MSLRRHLVYCATAILVTGSLILLALDHVAYLPMVVLGLLVFLLDGPRSSSRPVWAGSGKEWIQVGIVAVLVIGLWWFHKPGDTDLRTLGGMESGSVLDFRFWKVCLLWLFLMGLLVLRYGLERCHPKLDPGDQDASSPKGTGDRMESGNANA